MSEKAFQRIYTKLSAITKATVTLEAQGVANDELALVAGRLAQVVKIKDNSVTLQVWICQQARPTDLEFRSTLTTGYGTLFSGMLGQAAEGRPAGVGMSPRPTSPGRRTACRRAGRRR